MHNMIDNRAEAATQPIVPSETVVTKTFRTDPLTMKLRTIFIMALVIGAEIVTVFIGVIPGALVHGLLIFGLTNLYYFSRDIDERRVYLALILLPLLRFLSVAVPNPLIDPAIWYVLIGLPLLIATLWIAGVNKLPSLRTDLSVTKWVAQAIISLSGIFLGVVAALILAPPAEVVNSPDWGRFVIQVIVITLFSAVIEEIIFRGLVQNALSNAFGLMGIIFTSILYASMLLGTLSPSYILFYGLSGLIFSIWVKISGSLWGVIAAHGLMNIVFLVLSRFFLT